MIEVIEVMEDDAKFPIELEKRSIRGKTVFPLTKDDAIQLLADLQKAVDNLE